VWRGQICLSSGAGADGSAGAGFVTEEPVPKASGWYCDVHPGTEIAWLVPEGNPIKVSTRQLTWPTRDEDDNRDGAT